MSVIEYIINFISADNLPQNTIGYEADQSQWSKYKLVIVPSGFFSSPLFGTRDALPTEAFEFENSVIFYGTPTVEHIGSTIVCYADLVASSFLLLSRYEEWCDCIEKDVHSRVIGKETLLGRLNLLHRPLVDEYREIIRKWLNINITEKPKIYLTHDVDILTRYRTLRSSAGAILRRQLTLKQLINIWKNKENDPVYCFKEIISIDNEVTKAQQIYFIKAAHKPHKLDYPSYNHKSGSFKSLAQLLKQHNIQVGAHISYASAEKYGNIGKEIDKLRKEGFTISSSRNHYLRWVHLSEQAEQLIENHILDDFTLAYADTLGYRLGTCREVRYIDINSMTVTELTLHPLTAMDCTLSDYMSLNEEEAYDAVKVYIDNAKKYGGEIVLLWHNQLLNGESYHLSLYKRILKDLI